MVSPLSSFSVAIPPYGVIHNLAGVMSHTIVCKQLERKRESPILGQNVARLPQDGREPEGGLQVVIYRVLWLPPFS